MARKRIRPAVHPLTPAHPTGGDKGRPHHREKARTMQGRTDNGESTYGGFSDSQGNRRTGKKDHPTSILAVQSLDLSYPLVSIPRA